jgi:hypothetical protein
MMRPCDTISLFAEASVYPSPRGPSSFVVSTLVHGAALGMLSYGILYNPIIDDQIVTERYTLRHLELHTSGLQEESGEDGFAHPGPRLTPRTQSTEDQNNAQTTAIRQVPSGAAGHQTLVQPDFHWHFALSEETPVSTIVTWAPELAASPKIVPPLLDKRTAADRKPSLEAPNEESNLADLSVTATDLAPRSQAISPGTTSPVVVHAVELLQLAPATISNSNEQPTPATVLSLSDVRIPEGAVTIPPVDETQSSASSNALGHGEAKMATSSVESSRSNWVAAMATGHQAVNSGEKPDGTAMHARQIGTTKVATARESEAETFAAEEDRTYHFTVPKNGQFGVVVVGTSLADEYPETLQVWNDRVAYTAYLHVGLSKNWILQYSLVRAAESAAGGTIARLEAPWPFDIVRPNLLSHDLNADALMVHGFLNQAGRFESLTIAFPAQYGRAAFVLHSLQQWQFRPARQYGRATTVEVLLIIPDQLE